MTHPRRPTVLAAAGLAAAATLAAAPSAALAASHPAGLAGAAGRAGMLCTTAPVPLPVNSLVPSW